MESSGAKPATTRNQPPSRPSTPLRPSSRTSLRDSQAFTPGGHSSSSTFPLAFLEPAFAELSDSMADLEANMMHLQLMHESLSRFNENFASFLYGLNMNAFCVDFPEAPIPESFKRFALNDESGAASASTTAPEESSQARAEQETEATFLTTDTSFFDKPPNKMSSKFPNPPAPSRPSKRGGGANHGGPRGARGARPSGIARGKPRGAR
ncbi:MAG: hypothetical protein LQ342_001375 [Letrouitia transgressa]|nr:MAG: hypothetical protein LQ342_001375 [Letrouitia transgressa]